MKQVRISDVTMKQATEEFSLSFKEKIELAKLLDRLGASVIELEGVHSSRIDSLRIKSIAAVVTDSTVAVPVQLTQEGVNEVWNALNLARHPRLQVCAAVSPVQMEYIHHKKPDAMLSTIREITATCKALCDDVEFVADDATRSDPQFLQQAICAAMEAGANTITVCDAAGNMLPDEFSAFMDSLYAAVPQLKEVCLGVSCVNTLSMADACTVAAVRHGAGEVKTASFPVVSASLANIAKILAAKGSGFDACSRVNVTQLSRVMGQIAWMCQTGRSKTSPFDAGVREEDGSIYLTAHDDIGAVSAAVQKLGYDLSEEDILKVYDAFRSIAAKKEQVSAKELDAIVASAAMQVPSAYVLQSYVINAGNTIAATAHLKIARKDTVLEGVSIGDGPIDAAFLAIEQITGQHYELDDFQLQAVTEGRGAMGQTVVKLRSNGKLYSGRGISTDIVGAGIQAYLSALNKIVYEEEGV